MDSCISYPLPALQQYGQSRPPSDTTLRTDRALFQSSTFLARTQSVKRRSENLASVAFFAFPEDGSASILAGLSLLPSKQFSSQISMPTYKKVVRSNAARQASSSVDANVFSVLSKSTQNYMSADKVADVLGINEKAAERSLGTNKHLFRKSLTPTPDGRPLFALRDRVSAINDFWKSFKALNSAKFG